MLLNLFVSTRPGHRYPAAGCDPLTSVHLVYHVNITHTQGHMLILFDSEWKSERIELDQNVGQEVSISPDKEHRPHKQHVVMFLMRPGWYLCPASPSVLKVAQRSSPSDPRVLVSATCWSVSITCWGSQTETRARRHRGNWHSPPPLFSWPGLKSHTSNW